MSGPKPSSTARGVGSRLTTDFYPPRGVASGADRKRLRVQRLGRVGSR